MNSNNSYLCARYALKLLSSGVNRYIPYTSRLLYLKNRRNKEYVKLVMERTNCSEEELTKDSHYYIKNLHQLVFNLMDEIIKDKGYVNNDDIEAVLDKAKEKMEEDKNDIFLQKRN